MSGSENDLRIRFYGRFLFYQRSAMELTALAINMQYNKDVPAGHHDPFLLVPEAFVSTDMSAMNVGTTMSEQPFMPTHRVITSDGHNDVAHSIWDLSGYKVETSETGGFKWAGNRDNLADLREMARSPLARPYYDSVPPDSAVTALIRIQSGEGALRPAPGPVVPGRYDYIRFADNEDTAQRWAGGLLSDGVEVRLPNVLDLRFTFTKLNMSKFISVTKAADIPLVLGFSNLSGMSATSRQDKEFAGFYEVFDNPPPLAERRVPCLEEPMRSMFPMGNCYVAAKVTNPG